MKFLAIKDLAEQTGLAPGTIRMWEQRYGFPEPGRTGSGYRQYTAEDVLALRRVLAFKREGLSIRTAIDRARATAGATDRPSIYGALMSDERTPRPQLLRKRTLCAISRAMEEEALARAAAPIVVGAFQRVANYDVVRHRYDRIAQRADACVVFADFEAPGGGDGGSFEVPIDADDAMGNEWAVVVDAPGYAACLLAWEQPGHEFGGDVPDMDRRFESIWTIDPEVVRRATHVACALVGARDVALQERLESLLRDRPLATEQPAPALTALTNRILGLLER